MKHRTIHLLALALAVGFCQSALFGSDIDDLKKKAAEFHNIITIPQWESKPDEVKSAIETIIRESNQGLDVIGSQDLSKVTFDSTIGALDAIAWKAGNVSNRIQVVKETSPDSAVREMGSTMVKAFEEWAVGVDYRQDVYRAIKAYEKTGPKLEGEQLKLYQDTLRDYRRAGLDLPEDQRAEVEKLRKELSKVGSDFDTNISNAQQPVKFTRAELQGVPESFLTQSGVKTGEDEFTVLANVTWQYLNVMENAVSEATRKKLFLAHDTIAKSENIPLLTRMVELRAAIAAKLSYGSWADYQIEPRMAKTGKTALEFLEKLKAGLQPKFDAEMAELQKLKAQETGDPAAVVNAWDWRYFQNQLKKKHYAVDAEALRVYFPMEKTLAGMFAIYERIFGLKIARLDPPQKWVEDLQLYSVSDATTGEPLGLFYLDLYPREGKYHHFAQFGIVDGKRLPDGSYQRPTVAVICNFPPPDKDKPSLLPHSDVETLFHEFGHAMHSILTRANFATYSGTSVPRDFVEAPSQMLENWVWDKQVLDGFAADYRDPSRKIPQEILDKLEEAKLATIGFFYRRQLWIGLTDLALHGPLPDGVPDVVKVSNRLAGEVFLPVPDETAFVASIGHLNGYDAGYYGYAWADVIAADMATVFKNAPDRFLDVNAGRRLRDEIYAPGGSRDAEISIRQFLGRPQSMEPFLKTLGIGEKTTRTKD
jgi:thimet oligopeptidase